MATGASEEGQGRRQVTHREVKGIVNARMKGGCQEYKVRFHGCTTADDAWVTVDAIDPSHVADYRKARAASAASAAAATAAATAAPAATRMMPSPPKRPRGASNPGSAAAAKRARGGPGVCSVQAQQRASAATTETTTPTKGYVGFYKTRVLNADPRYKCFNNLHPAPFVIPAGGLAEQLNPAAVGAQFQGVENAFQLLKFAPEVLRLEDVALFARSSGAVAFYLGSSKAGPQTLNMQYRNPALQARMREFKARRLGVRPGWDDVHSVPLMKELLQLKFRQNLRLRSLLLETGGLPIVERSPTDAKWGDAHQHQHALGQGRNLLGKLLVEVRGMFKAQASG
jgi:ribA/ribD-fused uncharacterized protein